MTDLRVPGTHHMGPDALFIRHRLCAGPYTSLDPAIPANSRLGKAIRSQAGYCLPRRRVPAARRIQTSSSGGFCSASKDGDFTFGVRSNGLLGAGAAAEFLVERTRDIGFGTGPVDGPHRVH